MNARVLKLGVSTALMLALSACAGTPAKVEDPHHYSNDRDGNRVACYTTEAANEYECVPVLRTWPHGYAYDPFWDPWAFGLAYGSMYRYRGVIYYYPGRYPHGRRPHR